MYISLNLKKRKDAHKLTGGAAGWRDGGSREYRFPCGVYISYIKGVEAGDYGLALNASDQISKHLSYKLVVKNTLKNHLPIQSYYIRLWICKNAATFFHTVGSTDYLA